MAFNIISTPQYCALLEKRNIVAKCSIELPPQSREDGKSFYYQGVSIIVGLGLGLGAF